MTKKFLALLLAVVMVCAMGVIPVSAAEELILEVGAGKTYATVKDAVNYVKTLTETVPSITYVLYDDQTIVAESAKYEPDLAQGKTTVVNVEAAAGTSPKLTLAGVYYGRFGAEGATLNMSGLTLADARNACGEGTNPDPFEFCYLEFDCDEAYFTNCTFEEGVLVSGDNTFEKCYFTIKPQYYTAGNNFDPDTDYGADHYALWIDNTGTITVNNCTFEDVDYGAIKGTYGYYGTGNELTLNVSNTNFVNCGSEGEHKIIHLDDVDGITLEDCVVSDCYVGATGDSNPYINNKNNSSDNGTELAPVTSTGNVEKDNYTATFVVDGTTYKTVTFFEGDTELSEYLVPEVPKKEGYICYWSSYELNNEDVEIKAVYVKISERSRVSFVADGRLVGIILYRANQDELTVLPKVPAKEGYVGTWAEYTLTGKNMIVRAVYTPIAE